MQQLTSKIAALTEQSMQAGINAVDTSQRVNNGQQQRFFKQTPQNQQRDNYARDFNIRTPQGGATGFLQRMANSNEPECGYCGRHHARSARCFAMGQQCRNCLKFNHFARKCRGGRQQLQPSAPPQQ